MGAHPRFAEIPGELLLPVRPRLHRRPGPHGAVLRGHLASWRPPKSKRSRCGTGRRNRRATRIFRAPASSRRRSSTGDDAAAYHAAGEALLAAYAEVNELRLRLSVRAPAAARRHEARRLPAQHRGARLRRGALPAVLGRADQRRPGDQHPHAGEADPPAEGVGVRGTARAWATRSRRPARADPDCVWDANAAAEAAGARRWRATPMPTSTPSRSREDLRQWAAQNLPAGAGVEPGPRRSDASHERARRYRRDAALSGDRPPVPRAVRDGLRLERARSAPR